MLFTDFLNAAETIKNIIEKIPGKKINEYIELANKWDSILISHDMIKRKIHTLKELFSKISKGHTIKVLLERYLGDYNYFSGPELVLSNDDSFKIEIYQPNENRCFLDTLRWRELNSSLDIIFSHLIVSFFSNFNPKKVKQCPYCDLFYIAKDIKRKRCYSLECQKEFEKQKKRTQREREPQIYS